MVEKLPSPAGAYNFWIALAGGGFKETEALLFLCLLAAGGAVGGPKPSGTHETPRMQDVRELPPVVARIEQSRASYTISPAHGQTWLWSGFEKFSSDVCADAR